MSHANNKVAAAMLRRVGRALYPDDQRFHIALAHRLGVATATMKDWMSGRTRFHPDVFNELDALMTERASELIQTREKIVEWRRT